jgi:hypothetical protein
MDNTTRPYYRLEGALTGGHAIGLVADGIRADNTFEGTIVEGELQGAHVDGIDYFRVRPDGVGIVTGREIITLDDTTIAVSLHGIAVPPAGMDVPPLEVLASPDFEWPDVEFTIEAFATFETSCPAHQHLNRTTVVHSGTVNLATGALVIEARRPTPVQPRRPAAYAAYPG